MEILFNDNVIGKSPKYEKKIIIRDITSDDNSLIKDSNIIKVNNKKFYINLISDNLVQLKDQLKDGEFKYNCDMYEDLIPLKYSVIKRDKDIYLYSLELS